MSAQARSQSESGLVVVSNRLPFNLPRRQTKRPPKRNVGGLVSAVEPVLAQKKGTWIGWDGFALPSAGAVSSVVASPRRYRTDTGIDLYGVPLSERELALYYHGFANRCLWPLFHNLLPTAVFNPEDWACYDRVNRRFAETVLARASKQDRIWVHDYHLMLVPAMLREMGFKGRIDFFLHIPFPAPDIFRSLPWRDELLHGLLAANTVAFHVSPYTRNFIRSAEYVAGARFKPEEADEYEVEHPGGRTLALTAPIGIDVAEFERIAELPRVQQKTARLRSDFAERKIIFGADRLDYTKGIKERFLAVEHYLRRNPEAAGTFDLVQIVVPSRHQVEEYRLLKREIDEIAGRINGEWGQESWAPIRYRFRALNREELVAYYRAADVAIITPLKDGMNLVAPEFVASRTDGDGVLVVSEFAGIATRLSGVIMVNPYNLDAYAGALDQALHMEESERLERMAMARSQVRDNPVSTWAERCLGLDLTSPGGRPKTAATGTVSRPLASWPLRKA